MTLWTMAPGHDAVSYIDRELQFYAVFMRHAPGWAEAAPHDIPIRLDGPASVLHSCRVRKLFTCLALASTLAAREGHAQEPMGLPQAEPPPPTRQAPRNGFSAHLDLGMGARWLYGDPIVAFDGTFGLGGRLRNVHLYGDLHLLVGRVEGLTATAVDVGPSVDVAIVERLRLGGGLAFGGMKIGRVTSGGSAGAFTFGARAFVAYDVLRLEEHRDVFVKLGVGVDFAAPFAPDDDRAGNDPTALPGPTLAIGGRL